MEKKIKINTVDKIPDLDNKKAYKALSVVPSTLMRTPSSNFAKAFEFMASVGMYKLDLEVKDDTKLEFKELQGFFKSDVGIHYTSLINDIEYIVNLKDEDDGDYDVYLTINFNENDSENADYKLDDFIFNLVSSGDDKPYDNSQKIATLTMDGGDIKNLKIVCNFVDKPDYSNIQGVATSFKQKVKAGEDLSKLDVVRIAGYNNGLPKVEKVTALTQTPLGICLDDFSKDDEFMLLIKGIISNVDTSDYEQDIIYTDGAGGFQNNGVSFQLGEIVQVDNDNGVIDFYITDNSKLFSQNAVIAKDTKVEKNRTLMVDGLVVKDGVTLTIDGDILDIRKLI